MLLKYSNMKKIILTIAFIASGMVASAQVGIGNEDPKVSLQVDRSTDNAQADGILVPRTTVAQLNDKAAAYAAEQNGTLVFVTAIAGVTGQTSNIAATGFHYYDFLTDKWVALRGGNTAGSSAVFATTSSPIYSGENVIIDTNASGNHILNLPTAASYANKLVFISNSKAALSDANGTITLVPAPAFGADTVLEARGTTLFSDGVNWYRIGQ